MNFCNIITLIMIFTSKDIDTVFFIVLTMSHQVSQKQKRHLDWERDLWWNKFLHFAPLLFKDLKLDHLTFHSSFARETSGLILHLILPWPSTGVDLLLLLRLVGIKIHFFGGQDFQLPTHKQEFFLQMELLISDHQDNIALVTVLSWLQLVQLHNILL